MRVRGFLNVGIEFLGDYVPLAFASQGKIRYIRDEIILTLLRYGKDYDTAFELDQRRT